MIQSNQKTSLLVPYQLPEFIRDDPNYANFVLFLQAYYEWMEETVFTVAAGTGSYSQGETVTQVTFTATVKGFDSQNNILYLNNGSGKPTVGVAIVGNSSGTSRTLLSSGQSNTLDFSKNLLNYMDVDTTTDQFLQYYVNDFMSYFPQEILADKTKAIKIAKQLYQNKGTPASYQFLFRILYNSDVDFFYTKDVLLKPSTGKWYVPKSLKLATNDQNFLQIQNLRLIGNTSKSIATVENAIYDGKKTEVFISNIERLFQSGETVTVVDNRNQPVYFLNGQIVPMGTLGAETLTALIVGQISQVNIDPNNRGLTYLVNDPIVVYGGLNPNIAFPAGATAVVGSVTSGGIQRITVDTGGYGYTLSPANTVIGSANTYMKFSNLVGDGPQTPIAAVGTLNPIGRADVSKIPVDSIQLKQYHYIGNIATSSGANTYNPVTKLWTQQSYQFSNLSTANANTSLANAFTFDSFSTYPIFSVIVQNQGGGLTQQPTLEAVSEYTTDAYEQTRLSNLGILAPIIVTDGGRNYSNGDAIVIIGGSGYGAYANVISVDANGTIQTVGYTSDPTGNYPPGGLGYNNVLPVPVVANVSPGTITTSNTSNVVIGTGTSFTTHIKSGAYLVSNSNVIIGVVSSVANSNTLYLTSNAAVNYTNKNFYKANSQLYIPSYLGVGASFTQVSNRVGSITTINLVDNGQDYVGAPNVSLVVQDLIVSNVNLFLLPSAGDTVYQGANINSASYIATVDSLFVIQPDINPANSIYQMRVFNYNSKPVQNTAGVVTPLKITSKNASINLVSGYTIIHNTTFNNSANNSRFDAANGVITYGDGHAKANAKFLNGLVIGQGQYLDSTGQPSSYDVLQSTIYNNFTYQITLSKEIEKYRDVLLNLLHPTGMQVFGRIAMTSNNHMNFIMEDALFTGEPISYYTNQAVTAQLISGTFASPSNNIISFTNLLGANLANIFVANVSSVVFSYGSGNTDVVKSLVTSVDGNNITIQDNVWTYFANVATGNARAGNNQVINISTLTGNYDIVNNGQYSNTQLKIADVIRVGDNLYVNGSSQTVTSVALSANVANSVVTLSGPLASGANGVISIGRTITSLYNNVQIFGPVGTQYYLELTTESGDILITEDGNTLLIG